MQSTTMNYGYQSQPPWKRAATATADVLEAAGSWLTSAMCGLCLAVLMASSEIAPAGHGVMVTSFAPWRVGYGIAAIVMLRGAYLCMRTGVRTWRAR